MIGSTWGRTSGFIGTVLCAGRSKDDVLQYIQGQDDARVHYSERVSGNETISATLTAEQVEQLIQLDAVQYVEEAYEIAARKLFNIDVAGLRELRDRVLDLLK